MSRLNWTFAGRGASADSRFSETGNRTTARYIRRNGGWRRLGIHSVLKSGCGTVGSGGPCRVSGFGPGWLRNRHDSRSGAGDATECVAGGTAKILDNSHLCTYVHLCIHSYTDDGIVIQS